MSTRVTNRWTPLVIGGVLLTSVVGAAALSGTADTKAVAPGTAAATPTDGSAAFVHGTDAAGDTTPAETAPPTTVAADTVNAVADVALTRSLKEGMSGDDVGRLQQRLKDLHFEPGDVTGTFTHLTTQAVWAFQKLVLDTPPARADGMVTQDIWSKMEGVVTVTPKKTNSTSTHVEVYVPQQVMVVFKNNAPVLISHVSTGSGLAWKATITVDPGTPDNPGVTPLTQHITGTALTPSGTYKLGWRVSSGWRTGKLGRMYKPTYFVGGVAVHGMTNVPNSPASHGCVRLPMGNTDSNNNPTSPNNPADEFPTLVPLQSQIFLFTTSNPSAKGSAGAPYDQPDPDFATTVPDTTIPAPVTAAPSTTVAATTVPKTTVPKTTTIPATTTTVAAATTTVGAAAIATSIAAAAHTEAP